MEEIEVGEYVRTKNGQIDIFKENDENYMFARCEKKTYWKLDIVNHNKIISEIVEEGDYVNGYYVRKILNYNNELCVFDLNEMDWIPLTEIDVFYSIVTKEQFKSVEYEVK